MPPAPTQAYEREGECTPPGQQRGVGAHRWRGRGEPVERKRSSRARQQLWEVTGR